MSKVAKFVEVIITARVIVDENASEADIFAAAKKRIQYKALNEYEESGVNIHPDLDMPFDPSDPEDNPDMEAFIRKFGKTDAEMRSLLTDLGYKGVEDPIALADCATASGYIYSFVSEKWFNKDQDGFTEEEEACIEMIKSEPEHQI